MRLLTNRWIHVALLLALLLSAVYHSGSSARWRREMQYLVFDTLNQLFPRDESGQVAIVDIDDDSLLRLGQWPWPRTKVAEMVDRLTQAGAKVIAFDGVLAEPDRSSPHYVLDSLPKEERFADISREIGALPDHDELLAKAIERSGIFVSGFTYGSYTQQPRPPYLTKPILIKKKDFEPFLRHAPRFDKTANFLPGLEKAAAGNGSFMASPEEDGVLRRTGMVFSDGKTLFPSLSLEALRVAQGNKKLVTKIGRIPDAEKAPIDTDYRIVSGNFEIPVDSDGLLWVYYRPFHEGSDDYFSAYKVLDPAFTEQTAAAVRGKIVLVGSSAEGLKDLRSTPLEPFQPGVEVHANVIEQILQGRYLLRPAVTIVAEASFILLSGLLMIVLAPFIHVLWLGALCFSGIGLAFVGAATAYTDYGLLLDPFYPSLSVFVIFMVSTLLTYMRVEAEKQQVRGAFGLYISPDFMKELTKNPDRLKLGGETKELSIMFTDIRSFTTICEGLRPEEIIQLMNDFLTPMSDLVMQNRGTIDKYMGDAMMAFWNAPLDDTEHARHACIAALGMQAALEPINAEVRKKAEALGKAPVLLNAGIGINTGECAVGNMGSRQRFAYSILGDAVNLASRLEGQTKTYGVNILIGESTLNAVPDFAALEMDLIKVKGKSKPVRVFALFGNEEFAQRTEFKLLKEHHNRMIFLYRSGDFKGAQEALRECRKSTLLNLDEAYGLYKDRIAKLIKNPPPEGQWDGVYEAKTK